MASKDFAEAPPNQTVYVQNLNEKIKIEELKKSLYHVYSQFGNILDIHCKKTLKMRGQAWIIFEDMSAATKALREMQGFNFYAKPMKCSYAKVKSDVIAKKEGTFVPRPKRTADSKKPVQAQAKKKKTETKKKAAKEGAEPMETDFKTKEALPAAATAEPSAPPNRILFVENLPTACNDMMLSMLFQQYNGYKEARLVPGKPGIAFVEFGDQFQSSQAKDSLQGFKITEDNLMKISFARQ
jgi:RNA recognition motif-containing protein